MRQTSILLVVCFLAIAVQAGIVDTMLDKLKKTGNFNSEQLTNARAILTGCSEFTSSENQLAYVLSTAIGESNLRPIKEFRAKAGTSLFNTQNKYWGSGYYGRGYVQLTWDYNYKKFGSLLGVDLLGNPDLALRADVAGKIICVGMAKGLFTGKGLNDYFSGSKADWNNARRIINGTDKAAQFGERAKKIANA